MTSAIKTIRINITDNFMGQKTPLLILMYYCIGLVMTFSAFYYHNIQGFELTLTWHGRCQLQTYNNAYDMDIFNKFNLNILITKVMTGKGKLPFDRF